MLRLGRGLPPVAAHVCRRYGRLMIPPRAPAPWLRDPLLFLRPGDSEAMSRRAGSLVCAGRLYRRATSREFNQYLSHGRLPSTVIHDEIDGSLKRRGGCTRRMEVK